MRSNTHSYQVTFKMCNLLQDILLATRYINYYSHHVDSDHENDLGIDILHFRGHVSGESNVSVSIYITFILHSS